MVARLKALGASEVIQHGANIAEAQQYIQEILLPKDPDGVFVPPFDHADIWEGNATIMEEIADQLGEAPDVVICSVGGGGLLNGIIKVVNERALQEKVDVLAMETVGADSLHQSLEAGQLVTLPKTTSRATSLGVVRVSQQTFEYAQLPNVTSFVLPDEEAARGCWLLAEAERLIVELTVGVNIPLCYDGLLQKVLQHRKTLNKSSKVVIVACGGNDISVEMLMSWRQQFLARDTVDSRGEDLVNPHPTSVAA